MGTHTIAGELKWEQGAEPPPSPLPPHFNHWHRLMPRLLGAGHNNDVKNNVTRAADKTTVCQENEN